MMREVTHLNEAAQHGGFLERTILRGKLVFNLFPVHLMRQRESLPFESNFSHQLIGSVLTVFSNTAKRLPRHSSATSVVSRKS